MSKISAEKGSTIARSESQRISDERLKEITVRPSRASYGELDELIRLYRLAMDREGLRRVSYEAQSEHCKRADAGRAQWLIDGTEWELQVQYAFMADAIHAYLTTGEKGK